MSRFNTLLHGSAADAAAILGGEVTPARDEILLELRAALTNALNRIDRLEERNAPPVKARETYTVKAEKLIAFGHLHELDEEVEGEYTFCAISHDDALDQFHRTVPVKVLDDFEFTAYSGRCGDCGAAGDPGAACRKCGRGMIG